MEEQLALIEAEEAPEQQPEWRLTPEVRAVGQRGLQEAREALRRARANQAAPGRPRAA